MANSDRPGPSFFMLVPGPWATGAEIVRGLKEFGIDARPSGGGPVEAGIARVDLIEDDELGQALGWGR